MSSSKQEINWTKSQRAILDAAKKLFWKYGISRVTVDEISTEADVSKMTFYRHFKNKYELAKIILEAQILSGIQEYRRIINSECSFREKLTLLIQHKQEEAKAMSMEFIGDLYSPNENMQALLQVLNQAGMEYNHEIKADFKKAQDEGHLRASLNIDHMMYMMQLINKEMESPQLRSMFSSTEVMTKNLMDFFFYGILEGGRS